MKNKLYKLFIILIFVLPACQQIPKKHQAVENAVFGIDFDEVWFVALRYPWSQHRGGTIIFDSDGNPDSKYILTSRKIGVRDKQQLLSILNNNDNFNQGGDLIGLSLYSLVFYKNKCAVLIITPNLAGYDFGVNYTKEKKEFPIAWSDRGMNEMTTYFHCQLGRISTLKTTLPPNSKGLTEEIIYPSTPYKYPDAKILKRLIEFEKRRKKKKFHNK
jgi:hypothetical protein